MNDELEVLHKSNPISRDDLETVVAFDQPTLLEMSTDKGRSRISHLPRRSGVADQRSREAGARARYLAVAATAAVAVAMAITGLAGQRGPSSTDPADDTDHVPLVVDDRNEQPTSTAAKTSLGEAVEIEAVAETPADDPMPSTTEPASDDSTIETSTTNAVNIIDGPFDLSVDLLSLHFDHANRDDGHAAVAAMEIASFYGIEPAFVHGTHPENFDGAIHDFEPLANRIWGDEWYNAGANRIEAVTETTNQWIRTIDAGGRVWVAEGGTSDFTASVVTAIRDQRPDIDTRTFITVVQHNNRNESATTPEKLDDVRANTTYQRIDDGNSVNETADLNQTSDAFIAAALGGENRDAWQAAFDYMSSANLDFSDTVEVLHIMGVSLDDVADPDDFARFFMG